MKFQKDDIVKSCRKLETGLRLGVEGIHACQLGQFSSPLYWVGWGSDELKGLKITKEMIAEKREQIFQMLNDDHTEIPCKHCSMVIEKRYGDVDFNRLGHIDLAATTTCNLRCNFCGYTTFTNTNNQDCFIPAQYDALAILREFAPEDVEWDAAVDFNGGEPSLMPDFDEFIDYFTSRRIRVFLYTNAVKFRQSICDGLASGAIRWVCTSLDAGTPSSFKKIKTKDYFPQVMENLTRYAHAGSKGGGKLAVKYIFCEDNLSDDDIYGFAYAMLAIRPQSVWLTFDFEPLRIRDLSGDSDDFGGYDYSGHVAAYVKMYGLMQRHGLTAEHFAQRHLAVVSQHGKTLLERTLAEIRKTELEACVQRPEELILADFRQKTEDADPIEAKTFSTAPLQISSPQDEFVPWDLHDKRVLIAPACAASIALLKDEGIKNGNIVGFLDRDPVLQTKRIEGIPIYAYGAIQEMKPDIILIAAPEVHKNAILQEIAKHVHGDTVLAMHS